MITITLDPTIALEQLTAKELRQLPYAAMKALNQTAIDFQQEEQYGLRQRMTIRRPWVLQGIKIERGDFATKEKLAVTVHIANRTGEGADSRAFLDKFEEGGPESRPNRFSPFYMPSPNTRPSPAAQIQAGLYPKALRLMPRKDVTGTMAATGHVTRRGILQLQGKRRTFVLDPTTMFGVAQWGVYQRTGPGKGDIRLLWRYKARVTIPRLLHFHDTAVAISNDRWAENFNAAFVQAVRTMR